MGKALPQQHPAVVLRSHYVHLRALLAVMAIAVIGLTIALVIVAVNSGDTTTVTAAPAATTAAPAAYNGGHTEGGISATPAALNQRYDFGPEEGTAGH